MYADEIKDSVNVQACLKTCNVLCVPLQPAHSLVSMLPALERHGVDGLRQYLRQMSNGREFKHHVNTGTLFCIVQQADHSFAILYQPPQLCDKSTITDALRNKNFIQCSVLPDEQDNTVICHVTALSRCSDDESLELEQFIAKLVQISLKLLYGVSNENQVKREMEEVHCAKGQLEIEKVSQFENQVKREMEEVHCAKGQLEIEKVSQFEKQVKREMEVVHCAKGKLEIEKVSQFENQVKREIEKVHCAKGQLEMEKVPVSQCAKDRLNMKKVSQLQENQVKGKKQQAEQPSCTKGQLETEEMSPLQHSPSSENQVKRKKQQADYLHPSCKNESEMEKGSTSDVHLPVSHQCETPIKHCNKHEERRKMRYCCMQKRFSTLKTEFEEYEYQTWFCQVKVERAIKESCEYTCFKELLNLLQKLSGSSVCLCSVKSAPETIEQAVYTGSCAMSSERQLSSSQCDQLIAPLVKPCYAIVEMIVEHCQHNGAALVIDANAQMYVYIIAMLQTQSSNSKMDEYMPMCAIKTHSHGYSMISYLCTNYGWNKSLLCATGPLTDSNLHHMQGAVYLLKEIPEVCQKGKFLLNAVIPADGQIKDCLPLFRKHKILPSLNLPHDFVHLTPELYLTNPLNERGDNVLHVAVSCEVIGIQEIQYLLKQNDVSSLITKANLDGDIPLHKSQDRLVFECLLEEFLRSDGITILKGLFPDFDTFADHEGTTPHFEQIFTVLSKSEVPISSHLTLKLQLKQIHSQWNREPYGIVISTLDQYCQFSQGEGQELPDCQRSEYGYRPYGQGNNEPDIELHLEVLKPEHRPCSDTTFRNAVMCISTPHGPYVLYKKELTDSDDPACSGWHKVQQGVAISNECSPVPPYLGKKRETVGRGSIDTKHSSYTKQHNLPEKLKASAKPKSIPTSLYQQRSPFNMEQFSLAADCLHAQDYVRMLDSLPCCFICKPSDLFDKETQITCLFGCGLAHTKLSKQKEALKHFQTCETLAVKAERRGDVALCNQNIGDILLAKQSFISAAEHYSKAVDYYSPETVARNFKMIIPSVSGMYAKLASAFRNASKVVDAVQAYKNAIATAESKKDKLSAHTSLGNLYQSVGENSSALTEYEYSVKLSEELEDNVSLGWAHGNMGNAHLGLYQRDKALHQLEKSLELAVKYEPTPQSIGRAYNNLGTAYQALNEYDKAQENYDLALGQGIYGNDIPGQARVYGNIGNLLMVRQDYERAIPHYTEVLRLSRDRSTVSTAYHNRGCAFYELAENKKVSMLKNSPMFYIHGPVCEAEHQPPILPSSIIKLYRRGSHDLDEVVKFHEETLSSIKGSTKGLTLSVSLFESNSRTFHRLQDCLVNLGEWKKALVVAEQSRARTLGELLFKKKEWQLQKAFPAPLTLDHITAVVSSQDLPVLYLSYTGARLLGWVLSPNSEMGMFEVPLKDDQFEGKSFDYHLRYSLNEVLVERSFEMYRSFDYKSELNDPVINLYNLIGKPLHLLLKQLNTSYSETGVQSIIVIPDSYTNLLPFTCLLAADPKTDTLRFLGDQYSFQLMPSLLTMGILNQLPPTTVMIPSDSQNMCVVGNPFIPPFHYNGELWSLGKLPHATKEACWVSHILRTTPILHEQATKSAVLMRILNSKVIHIATHGSAASGFLAFAGMSSSRKEQAAEAGSVLIYPKDIEKQNISPALVVLSSCDSGRGEVKADGIQGMARAFILAGAQAVLTTLWRVPDESASIFMQFFYQYLVDGFRGTEALQKAILSLRSFSKYSQYIHWSGYQLTGREIQFDIRNPDIFKMLETRLGASSVFPRLDDVKKLESALINDPRMPTDVQILQGSPGMKPSEPLIDFVHSFHHHFKGGIFWINGRTDYLIEASTTYIEKVTGKRLSEITASDAQQVLVVIDYIEHLPSSEAWLKLLKNPSVHIVVVAKHCSPPELLQKEIDNQLLRGCKIINVEPLSMVHTIQRMAHSVHKQHHLAPGNEVQELFERLSEFTNGSPAIIDTASSLLLSHMKHDTTAEKSLREFAKSISLHQVSTCSSSGKHSPKLKRRSISKRVVENIPSVVNADKEIDPWQTDVHYDSWQVISNIFAGSPLSDEERLLIFSLSMFHCYPIPMSVVQEVSVLIAKASHQAHLAGSLHSKFFELKFLRVYPTPVVLHPSLGSQQVNFKPEFVYVPQYLSSGIWKHIMSPMDKVVALSTVFKALSAMNTQDTDASRSFEEPFILGLCSLLVELIEVNYELIGKECYQEVFKLFLSYCSKSKI